MGHHKLRRKVVETALKMVEERLIQGTWGNVSCRIPGEPFMIITPSGMDYQVMEPEDTVIADFNGNLVEGRWEPSTESCLHGLIYQNRQDVGAVVHTHSTYATAFAVARKSIPAITEEVAQMVGGTVDVVPYAPCGTKELAELTVKVMGRKNAVLLANHGVVGVGKDLAWALRTCTVVEKSARICVIASTLGGYVELPKADVEKLHQTFMRGYGAARGNER